MHVQFQDHDGAQDFSPLHLTLTSHPSLLTELKNLREAAASGRGLPNIGPDIGIIAKNIVDEPQEDISHVTDAQGLERAGVPDTTVDESRHPVEVFVQHTTIENGSDDNLETVTPIGSPTQPDEAEQSQDQNKHLKQNTVQDDLQIDSGGADSGPTNGQSPYEPLSNQPALEHDDQNEDEDGDLIDYSEDEDETEEAAIDSQNVSSESSTLQGDGYLGDTGTYQTLIRS